MVGLLHLVFSLLLLCVNSNNQVSLIILLGCFLEIRFGGAVQILSALCVCVCVWKMFEYTEAGQFIRFGVARDHEVAGQILFFSFVFLREEEVAGQSKSLERVDK